MKIKSYAKLNLSLDITGVQENGYHTLDMVMQTISLHDTIELHPAENLALECSFVTQCMEQNTAYRAAKLFFGHTGLPEGVHIAVHKRIPQQAGLGGGSSNGAAVLVGLNSFFRAGLSTHVLESLAAQIGADAPFFIRGGCARATGIGDVLTPTPNACDVPYLLAMPHTGVSTAAAYAEYDKLSHTHVDMHAVLRALAAGNTAAFAKAAGNALYPAAQLLNPQIPRLLQDCRDLGAAHAMMTGSGSCVFALFHSQSALRTAGQVLKKHHPFVQIANNANCGVEILPN